MRRRRDPARAACGVGFRIRVPAGQHESAPDSAGRNPVPDAGGGVGFHFILAGARNRQPRRRRFKIRPSGCPEGTASTLAQAGEGGRQSRCFTQVIEVIVMRKLLFIAAIALLGTLGLSACNNNQSNAPAAQAKLTKPSNPNDMKAWQAYLSQVVEDNMGDITNTPYAYFVPDVPVQAAAAAASAGKAGKPGKLNTAAAPASASSAEATQDRVQGQLNDVVAATVLPGNMVAAGGPNSATTAEVLENAFKQAAPGSFKGVVVLFVGDKADEAAVKAAVEPSGATFKFAQMQGRVVFAKGSC